MNQDIDHTLDSKSLISDLENSDANLALLLKQQDEMQNAKL